MVHEIGRDKDQWVIIFSCHLGSFQYLDTVGLVTEIASGQGNTALVILNDSLWWAQSSLSTTAE